jgi:hypothetical protein
MDKAEIIERLQTGDHGPELDKEIAPHLGWTERRQMRIGLTGRTRGRNGWVPPNPPWKWRARLPRFSGPKMRPWTISILSDPPQPSQSEGE